MPQYYKLLHENKIHHKFQYQDGLNTDTRDYGLYFTTEEFLFVWLDTDTFYWIYEVVIPEGAHVQKYANKLRADKIIIKNPITVMEFIKKYDMLKLFKNYNTIIKYFENPTKEMCVLAIENDHRNIKYIKNPSFELCKKVLEKRYTYIKYIQDPSEEVLLFMLTLCPLYYEKIENKTEAITKFAVSTHGLNLEHVPIQTEELCILAVREYFMAFKYVKETTPKIDQETLLGLLNYKNDYTKRGNIYYESYYPDDSD